MCPFDRKKKQKKKKKTIDENFEKKQRYEETRENINSKK